MIISNTKVVKLTSYEINYVQMLLRTLGKTKINLIFTFYISFKYLIKALYINL